MHGVLAFLHRLHGGSPSSSHFICPSDVTPLAASLAYLLLPAVHCLVGVGSRVDAESLTTCLASLDHLGLSRRGTVSSMTANHRRLALLPCCRRVARPCLHIDGQAIQKQQSNVQEPGPDSAGPGICAGLPVIKSRNQIEHVA